MRRMEPGSYIDLCCEVLADLGHKVLSRADNVDLDVGKLFKYL